MSADLHTRLQAAIEEKLALAKAASSEWHRVGYVTTGDPPFLAGPGIAEFIAAHDPAAMTRLHEAALQILDEHAPLRSSFFLPPLVRCAYEWGDGDGWPLDWAQCPAVVRLAAAYDVPLDTEEADREA